MSEPTSAGEPTTANHSDRGTRARARLGRIGIWSMELRFGDPGQAADAAAELDELGFGALWIPGGVGGDVLGDVGPAPLRHPKCGHRHGYRQHLEARCPRDW